MALQLSDQVHANSCPTNSTSSETSRRTGNFHPSIWGDYFLKYASDSFKVDDATEEKIKQLKEEVKTMLAATTGELSQTLELVDTIQRLGISYRFEEEISKILRQIKKIYEDGIQNYDLHIVSLWFRLLRQEGYGISSDIFMKFTNEEGTFKNELTSDVQGMLSLYEASHFMTNEEPIPEEALSFTTIHLQSSITGGSELCSFYSALVKHALERPIRKDMQRIAARYFISIYHEYPIHSDVLLSFAKLDFNVVQKLHQKELGELTRWWKELDFASKLPYFRDRLVECYFWMMGIYFEPDYALGRNILVRSLYVLVIIDDTFDVHGTIDELRAFKNSVHRWNIDCLDQFPDYMKFIYKTLLDVYDESEKLMENEGRRSHQIKYAKEVMKEMVQSYFEEAEFFSKNYVPTLEEYKPAFVTSGQCFFAITSFLGMGDIATEEAFEWASKYPKIIRAGNLIIRFMGDIVSHKFEQERGHVASTVECYVKHNGKSEKAAYTEFRKQVSKAWKDINEECIEPSSVPMPLLTRIFNFPRAVDVLYQNKDNFTFAEGLMKNLIKSMFVDPLPI